MALSVCLIYVQLFYLFFYAALYGLFNYNLNQSIILFICQTLPYIYMFCDNRQVLLTVIFYNNSQSATGPSLGPTYERVKLFFSYKKNAQKFPDDDGPIWHIG